jgi:hypothetical protein
MGGFPSESSQTMAYNSQQRERRTMGFRLLRDNRSQTMDYALKEIILEAGSSPFSIYLGTIEENLSFSMRLTILQPTAERQD